MFGLSYRLVDEILATCFVIPAFIIWSVVLLSTAWYFRRLDHNLKSVGILSKTRERVRMELVSLKTDVFVPSTLLDIYRSDYLSYLKLRMFDAFRFPFIF